MSNMPAYSISGERAVISFGGKCPFEGCAYCFVRHGRYQDLPGLSVDRIVDIASHFPPTVQIIELKPC